MSDPTRLQLLAELRRQARPLLSQKAVAARFGLEGRQGRQTVSAWEIGKHRASEQHRTRFIGYLWDDLGLRRDQAQFEEVWQLLVEEWQWAPLSDDEWRQHIRTRRLRTPVGANKTPEQKLLTFLPPPEPARPPPTEGFVGRAAELADFAHQLAHRRLAVISGMAGVGKTALAAALSNQVSTPAKTFWHSFHDGEGIDVIIWKLAGFWAWHGCDELWRLLQSARQTGGQPPPTDMLFDYLLQLLRGRDDLLCLDDFHLVEDDPAFTRLVDRLQQVLTTASFSLLITTRRLPALTRLAPVEPLAGLNLTDARLLLVRRNVKLAEALIQQLHTLTAGNAQLLLLAIDLLHQASDGELLVDRLAAADHVEQYLLSAVDEGLSGRERAVMGAVAVLVGYPGTRAALEAILNSGNLWRTLHELHARHLLTVAEGAVDKRYSQHALLQQFYYQELSGQQRRHMHRRAGDYYAREEVDRLVAALHYERAGEYTLAAQEATRDVWGMINQGQAHTLVGVLERLQTAQLEINQWAQLCISQGLLCAFLGERKSASVHYRAVLAQLERLPAAPNLRELKARACRGLGELFELEHPPEALGWLQQGLAELQEMHSPEFAALQIRIGAVQMYGGNYTAALQALEIGLQHLPEGPSQLLSIALKNLGAVYGYQGDLQRAKEYALQALAINQQLHDLFEMNHILVNLGFLKDNLGDWPGAIADYQQAIALAGQLGSVQLQAAAELNLGALYVRTGEQAAALQHLQHSLAAAQTAHQYIIVILAYVNLADLFIRLRDWSQAENALNLAEELAVELEHKGSLIAIESAQAEIALAKGHHRLALDHAEQSIRLAREQGETLDEGASLRILGQVLRSTDQRSEAIAALSQSLELLEEKSPYEAARSKVQLGWALRTDGDRQRGEKLLQEARSTFADLGARHDLDLVEVV